MYELTVIVYYITVSAAGPVGPPTVNTITYSNSQQCNAAKAAHEALSGTTGNNKLVVTAVCTGL